MCHGAGPHPLTASPWIGRFIPDAQCDAARDRVVLYGGSTLTGTVGDTWEWDGKRWLEIAPP